MFEQMIEHLNLTETTSPRQAKNGTRQFFDPITNCIYTSHKTGFVRRTIPGFWGGWAQYKIHTTPEFCEVERMYKLVKYVVNYRKK